jgi:hypothetical protein
LLFDPSSKLPECLVPEIPESRSILAQLHKSSETQLWINPAGTPDTPPGSKNAGVSPIEPTDASPLLGYSGYTGDLWGWSAAREGYNSTIFTFTIYIIRQLGIP